MTDPTEPQRRALVAEINGNPRTRQELEAAYGQVWDTQELTRDFVIEGFAAPFVVGKRKSDGQQVTLVFQHSPRFYFDVGETE